MNGIASLVALVFAGLSGVALVSAQDEYPRAHIFGRITDVHGRALEGVQVRLGSVGDRWVSKELYPGALTGFRTETDTGGAFEFDMPVPTADWTSFTIAPGEFYTRDSRDFGPAGGRDEEPLREGENDLGTFVLADAGVIEGRISNEQGESIVEAYARLEESGPGGLVMNSNRVGDDGVYRIAHVPAGRWDAESLADGFVTGKRIGIQVVSGEVTGGTDFELLSAPSISGRVFDEEGAPLEGVRLRGWPIGGGQGASAYSASDGAFTMSLPLDTPYSIEAELAGYEHGDAEGARAGHAPGARDVQLVMRKREQVTFFVQDAVSGAPVTTFGLRVIRVRTEHGETSSSAHREAAPIRKHPGGEVALPGDTQYDDYTIVAPGYGPQRSEVWFDENTPGRQTIRLTPAGTLIGRWTSAGEGVTRPTVRIRADRVPLVAGVTEGEDDLFSENWGTKLDAFAGRPQRYTGEQDGSFRIDDLAAGIYVLRLSAPGVAPLAIRRVRVTPGETTDLGAVEAVLPGEIHGRVVLPTGVSTAGLIVAPGSAQAADDDKAQTTDANGEFVLEGLAEGTHYLWVEEKPGIVVRGGPTEVELSSSEVKSVRLELFDRVPCELRVQVLMNGQPAGGAEVSARPTKSGAGEFRVGRTDSSGLAVGYMKGSGSNVLTVKGSRGLLLDERSEPVDLHPGEQLRVELDFDAGRITARIPARFVGAESVVIVLLVRPTGSEDGPPISFVHVSGWELIGSEAEADLGWIAPGRYELELHAGPSKLTGEVEVLTGAAAVCVFAE